MTGGWKKKIVFWSIDARHGLTFIGIPFREFGRRMDGYLR